jgi:predicted esterase
MPTRLSLYPPSRPEPEDGENDEGMLQSMDYMTALIGDLISLGVPSSRIVGGFSQGHVMTMLTGLVSNYAGQLGGLVGLSGYMLPNVCRVDLSTTLRYFTMLW